MDMAGSILTQIRVIRPRINGIAGVFSGTHA